MEHWPQDFITFIEGGHIFHGSPGFIDPGSLFHTSVFW